MDSYDKVFNSWWVVLYKANVFLMKQINYQRQLSIYIFKTSKENIYLFMVNFVVAQLILSFFFFLQKRNMRTNVLLVCYPALLCILIVVFQHVYDNVIKHAKKCDPKTNFNCPTPEIPVTPPLLQVPRSPYRAVRTDFFPFNDLPDESCRRNGSCPATILLTGKNHSLGESILFSLPLVCVYMWFN